MNSACVCAEVDWKSQSLQVTRSLDAGCGSSAHSKVLSQRLHVSSQLLQSLQERILQMVGGCQARCREERIPSE